jgi:arginyl-tRNA synthetase
MDYLVIILLIAVVLLWYDQFRLNNKLHQQENDLYVLRVQKSILEDAVEDLLNNYQAEIDRMTGSTDSLNVAIDTVVNQINEGYARLNTYYDQFDKKLEQIQDLIK